MGGKRIKRTQEEQELFEQCKKITTQLTSMFPNVIVRASQILGYNIGSIQSFHGKIGGKNNEYANVADSRFQDYRQFQRLWAMGMIEKCKNGNKEGAVWEIAQLYRDDLCREYILLCQERNFYRHYIERIRMKPECQLWRVWFGGALPLGLFIAPAQLPDGTWRIDHSEIRRANYDYWTTGHILAVGGFINPQNNMMWPIKTYGDIEVFYQHIVASLSNSQYEQAICERYIEYLKQSADVNAEPFLIPEFHYEGPGKKCKYRMDFTILNPYTFEFTCFELSPSSSHFYLKREDCRTQQEFNADFAKMWKREFDKRNDYLAQYNMSCYTFTDEQLQDPDACFSVIANYLGRRAQVSPSMQDVLTELNALYLD